MTLLEVMVSQTIAVILVALLASLVVAMVKKLNAETNVADAQVRLRQASHAILRDTQGVGGELSSSGDLVVVDDGGANGSDAFTLFRRDESVCGGSLTIPATSGVNVDIEMRGVPTPLCPVGQAGCAESELQGRRVLLVGAASGSAIEMTGHNANSSACKLNFPSGQQATNVVAAYNAKYGTSLSNINGVLNDLTDGGQATLLVGSSYTYRVSSNKLQRSIDGGAFVDIVENIADLQVERIYDIDGDGLIDSNEVVTADTIGTTLPAGATDANFLGLRIGLIAFSSAVDGMEVRPPATFSNRTTSTLPALRRYRASFILAAARNRNGA